MQTYTHLGIGLVASQVFFPGDVFSQVLVVGSSAIPDVPAASMFLLDKLQGKQPLKEQSKRFLVIQEISHSLLIWLISGFCWPVFIGVYSHLLLDLISHNGEEFHETDPSFIWPLPWKLKGLFEYRTGGSGSLYSPWEILLTFICVIIFFWLRFF